MIDNKLRIIIPSNNINERIYACNVLFGVLLCIDFEIKVTEDAQNTIVEGGDKKIVIEDHFFNNYPKDLSYLKKDNIPLEKGTFHSPNGIVIPIIFGTDKLIIGDDEVICGLDIIASTFFMLSRWEEFVQGRKETGKCDEQLLFAVRNNLCSVPLVHLYEELLKNLIIGTGFRVNNERKFTVKPTHDVDRCYLTSWGELISNVKKIYKAGNKKKARKLLSDFVWYKIHEPDPFNTFSMFCSYADSFGVKDSFYFKCCEEKERGYTYRIDEKRVMTALRVPEEMEHTIGFHPSESTFNDCEQFKLELCRLKGTARGATICGRNHGLFCNTTTYKQWEDAGAEYVSNYGYQHRFGFRCGLSVAFPLFDVFERRQLKLYEIPFVLMDTVMYRNLPEVDVVENEIKEIINDVKKYNGVLCINWHTNVYNMPDMRKYREIYKFIFDYAKL